MHRSILSRTFKKDINNEYGIYDVTREAVDRSTQTEQQPAGNENKYDRMYEDQTDERENDYDKMYN